MYVSPFVLKVKLWIDHKVAANLHGFVFTVKPWDIRLFLEVSLGIYCICQCLPVRGVFLSYRFCRFVRLLSRDHGLFICRLMEVVSLFVVRFLSSYRLL